MIATDTNILVYAHRGDSVCDAQACAVLQQLISRNAPWAIPWPCIYEFFAIVTHPRIYSPPSTPDQALSQLDAWLEAPELWTADRDFGRFVGLRTRNPPVDPE